MKWDQEKTEQLRLLAAEGLSSRKIAEQLTKDGFRVTRNSVLGRAHRVKPQIKLQGDPENDHHRQANKHRKRNRRKRNGSDPKLKRVATTVRMDRMKFIFSETLKNPTKFQGVPVGEIPDTGYCKFLLPNNTWCGITPTIGRTPYCFQHHGLVYARK